MTVDCVIYGAHVAAGSDHIHMVDTNIIIDGGKIVGLSSEVPPCDKKIRADGLVALPGVVDPHVHYGVYSPIERAAATESGAAAIGGVTTMMRMMRLGGSYRTELPAQLNASKTSHYVDYTAHASIFNTAQADEMQYCYERGIKSFKLYMNLGSDVGHVYMEMEPGVDRLVEARVDVTGDVVRKTLENAASLGCAVAVHAEDAQSCACGIREARQKKLDGLSAWSQSRSPEFERAAIRAVSRHARETGCAIYIAHVGSGAALGQIQRERANGAKIYCETCPHYLTLDQQRSGYLAKVMPPVRTFSDQTSVWDGILSGAVTSMGTDHVANRLDLKLKGDDVWDALAGFPGIGTMLPILLSEGVNKRGLPIPALARLTSRNAATLFGMRDSKGAIDAGLDADIVLVDMKMEKRVDAEMFGGHSDYCVYDGWKLRGWPVRTLVRGETITDDFEVVGRRGYGRQADRRGFSPPDDHSVNIESRGG